MKTLHLITLLWKKYKKLKKNLPWKNSQGYDEIPIKLLQIIVPIIISPLYHIVNKSLPTDIFPNRMKYLITTPLHKKGNKNNVANFIPISLLPSFKYAVTEFGKD
jgi:hypothetical protein